MKNVTLSADANLIEAARKRAAAEHTTLNEQFRLWLEEYALRRKRLDSAHALLKELREKYNSGGEKFTRDEMNER